MKIILASQSPRRRELLKLMGLEFEIRVADIDETMDPNGDPMTEVARVSAAKAMAVDGKDNVVIAADTIVVCEGKILGKPHSEQEARDMLTLLSGRDHQVMTGFTVRQGFQTVTRTEVSHIYFRPLDPGEIGAYVKTGEPMDKAGAYGIQGYGALLVEGIRGDYSSVVGLPVCRLGRILLDFGVDCLALAGKDAH